MHELEHESYNKPVHKEFVACLGTPGDEFIVVAVEERCARRG